MSRRFQYIPIRSGTTLIEVLAGLVILSTLLVSLAMARGRFLHQWAQAQQRIIAAGEIDTLLGDWLALPPQSVPVQSHGKIDDKTHHEWQTRVLNSPSAASLGTIIVRLQITDSAVDGPILAQVDFLLRDPKTPGRAK